MRPHLVLLFTFIALQIPTLAQANLRLSLYELDFGYLPLGEVDQDVIFVRNGGKEMAQDVYCDVEGSLDFKCEETCKELRPSGACSLIITFSPTSKEKKTATVYLYSSYKTVKLKLTGQGYQAN